MPTYSRQRDIHRNIVESRREICVNFRTFMKRVSGRKINKIQCEKRGKRLDEVYFTDYNPDFNYQTPSLMSLNRKCNFEAGGETKLTESVILAKIRSSDFYLVAVWENFFL